MSLPTILVIPFRDPLFDSDCREAEDVLMICFVLRIAICVDIWFDDAVFNASSFLGCSRQCGHVSFPYVDCRLVVIECVSDGDCQSLHSVGGVFEQLLLEDTLDLGDERFCVVLAVSAGFNLV